MRFLADMGVAQSIVLWLREQGHDATHLREQNLRTLPDEKIFAKAIREDRVILTFDLDFGEIAALVGHKKVAIILFRLKNTRTQHVLERLRVVLATSEAALALARGALVIVEEARYRIRLLPISR